MLHVEGLIAWQKNASKTAVCLTARRGILHVADINACVLAEDGPLHRGGGAERVAAWIGRQALSQVERGACCLKGTQEF